jgi:hypothetical protein
MADVSAHTPIFSRGSAVLDYWLVHAEGLTIQPLGARVEEVVVARPIGHAEALIVRSKMSRRRKAIPAASIVAVEPSAGQLLMEVRREARPRLRTPRLSPERIAAARLNAGRGQRLARAHVASAFRVTRTGTIVALTWLRPRAVRVSKTAGRHTQVAAVQTARGVVWLTPRLAAGARTAGATAARLTLTVAVIVARGVARTARELERSTASAAERGRTTLEARRARRDGEPTD